MAVTKVSKSNPMAEKAAQSLAMQPNNVTKGFDVTKIDSIEPQIIEQLIAVNDLRALSPSQKVQFIKMLCQSLGLNPLSRPLQICEFKDPDASSDSPKKQMVYATKDCAEQLRRLHGVSVTDLKREIIDDLCIVTAYMTDKYGRSDVSTGAVPLEIPAKEARAAYTYQGRNVPAQVASPAKPLTGMAKANAIMKTETKAKRRGTLSICGLGFLDETQLEGLEDVKTLDMPEPTQEEIDAYNEQQEKSAQDEAKFLDEHKVPEEIIKSIEGAKTTTELSAIHAQHDGKFKTAETQALFIGELTKRRTQISSSASNPAGVTGKKSGGIYD